MKDKGRDLRGLFELRWCDLDYSERQLRLVLERMAMKLGVKMARAKTVVRMAVYMACFSFERRRGLPRRG